MVTLVFLLALPLFMGTSCIKRRELAQFLTETGKKQMESGDTEGAYSKFTYAIKLDSSYPPPYFYRGEIEAQRENYHSAAGDFSAAANLYDKPEDKSRALYHQAWSKRMLGEFNEALDIIDRAVKLNEKCADCYYYRGRIKADIGDYSGAIDDLDTYLKDETECEDARTYKAQCLMELGRYREAAKLLEELIESAESHQIKENMLYGYAQWAMGNIDKARNIFEKTRKEHEDRAAPLVGLARLKLASGDLEKARHTYNEAVWTNEEMPEAYLGRCVVEYLQKDLSTAHEDCVHAKLAYGTMPGAGRAMLHSWAVQRKMGQEKWARGAVSDYLEASHPVEWRRPALMFAADEYSKSETLEKLRNINLGGNSKMCEAYYFIAIKGSDDSAKSAKRYLRRALRECPAYSLEKFAAEYQLNHPEAFK